MRAGEHGSIRWIQRCCNRGGYQFVSLLDRRSERPVGDAAPYENSCEHHVEHASNEAKGTAESAVRGAPGWRSGSIKLMPWNRPVALDPAGLVIDAIWFGGGRVHCSLGKCRRSGQYRTSTMRNDHTDGYVIGLDLGGTKLMAGLFNGHDELVSKEYVLVSSMTADDLLETLSSTVRKLMNDADGPVIAAGYGVPTTIDQRTGTAVVAANLPIKGLPIREELARRTGLPTFIDNDANVAALAEQRKGAGAGRAEHLIMVTLGTGFGGGIIVDGQIMSGAIGAGAELGHMSIDFDGPPCVAPNCPGIGCIETFCSGSALARDVRAFVEANPASPLAASVRGGAPAKGELVVQHAHEGDPDAIGLLTDMGTKLGVALANLVNIFNPEMICLGGGLLAAKEWILPVATDVVRTRSLPPGNDMVRIVPAEFGPNAGMVGAAILARDGVRRGGRTPIGAGL